MQKQGGLSIMENIEGSYMTTANASAQWKIPQDKIRKYCREGKVMGAFKEKGKWKIPRNAVPPVEDDIVCQILLYILLVNANPIYEACKLDIEVQELTRAISYTSSLGFIEYSAGDSLRDFRLTDKGQAYVLKLYNKLKEELNKLKSVKVLKEFGDIFKVVGTITSSLVSLIVI